VGVTFLVQETALHGANEAIPEIFEEGLEPSEV